MARGLWTHFHPSGDLISHSPEGEGILTHWLLRAAVSLTCNVEQAQNARDISQTAARAALSSFDGGGGVTCQKSYVPLG